MRRAPRLGPYRIVGTFASSADGRVYRAYNSNTDVEVLVITSTAEDPGTAGTLQRRLEATVGPPDPVESHLRDDPAWLVLPREQTDAAARLIGLAAAPVQNPFAAAWGWPYYYPKTVRQLGFRCLCTVVGMAVVFWVFTGLTNLTRLLG